MKPKKKKLNAVERRSRSSKRRRAGVKKTRTFAEQNHDAILAAKKKRYETDPEFRQRTIEGVQRRRAAAKLAFDRTRAACPPRLRPETTKRLYCPTCFRPLPTPRRPKLMLIGKKYEVMMFTIGILANHIGKTPRTITMWIKKGVLPEAQYKGKDTAERLWTQDQVVAVMESVDMFDLRPPINFFKCGFADELKSRLQKLAPLGILPSLYSEPGEKSPDYLRRLVQDLPAPLQTAKRKPYGSKKSN